MALLCGAIGALPVLAIAKAINLRQQRLHKSG